VTKKYMYPLMNESYFNPFYDFSFDEYHHSKNIFKEKNCKQHFYIVLTFRSKFSLYRLNYNRNKKTKSKWVTITLKWKQPLMQPLNKDRWLMNFIPESVAVNA